MRRLYEGESRAAALPSSSSANEEQEVVQSMRCCCLGKFPKRVYMDRIMTRIIVTAINVLINNENPWSLVRQKRKHDWSSLGRKKRKRTMSFSLGCFKALGMLSTTWACIGKWTASVNVRTSFAIARLLSKNEEHDCQQRDGLLARLLLRKCFIFRSLLT